MSDLHADKQLHRQELRLFLTDQELTLPDKERNALLRWRRLRSTRPIDTHVMKRIAKLELLIQEG